LVWFGIATAHSMNLGLDIRSVTLFPYYHGLVWNCHGPQYESGPWTLGQFHYSQYYLGLVLISTAHSMNLGLDIRSVPLF
jgi:hypothetical protein